MQFIEVNLHRLTSMGKIKYIIVFSITLCMNLFLSCADKEMKQLESIESILDKCPQQALDTLTKIDVQRFSDDKKALYYLLLVKAKNYSDSISISDTLIDFSIRYYTPRKDSLRLFQAHYLRGRIFHKFKFLISAFESYQVAEKYSGELCDLKTKYLLNHYMGEIFHYKSMWEDANDSKLRTLKYSYLLKDTVLIGESLNSLAKSYILQSEFAKSKSMLHQALTIVPESKPELKCEILQDLCNSYLQTHQPDSALLYITQALRIEKRKHKQYFFYNLKANCYCDLNKNDSAEHYFKRSLGGLMLYTKVTTYKELYQLKQKQNNKEEALKYIALHLQYRDSLDNYKKAELIDHMQNIQAYKFQKKKADTAEHEISSRKVFTYRIVAGFLCVIIILLVSTFIHYKKKKRLERNVLEEKQKSAEALIERKEIEYYLLKEIEEREKTELQKMELKIAYFKRLNAITVPVLLKNQNRQGSMSLSEEEWNIVMENTDACFNGFTKRIKKAYPLLDEDEIRFCCLLKMELPLSLLSEIYHIAKGSISQRKMRMKEKLHVEQSSFDDFIKIF